MPDLKIMLARIGVRNGTTSTFIADDFGKIGIYEAIKGNHIDPDQHSRSYRPKLRVEVLRLPKRAFVALNSAATAVENNRGIGLLYFHEADFGKDHHNIKAQIIKTGIPVVFISKDGRNWKSTGYNFPNSGKVKQKTKKEVFENSRPVITCEGEPAIN